MIECKQVWTLDLGRAIPQRSRRRFHVRFCQRSCFSSRCRLRLLHFHVRVHVLPVILRIAISALSLFFLPRRFRRPPRHNIPSSVCLFVRSVVCPVDDVYTIAIAIVISIAISTAVAIGIGAQPRCRLTQMILDTGRWPESCILHWMVLVYKRNNVYKLGNYRGIHLTTQLSKVVERLLKALYVPYLTATVGLGPNQFAYTKNEELVTS